MKVLLDMALCQGHGQCVLFAPKVFELDGKTGLAVVLVERPDDSLRASAIDAARACPVRAITFVDE